MGPRWQLFRQNQNLSQQLSDKLQISPVIAQILLNRNISSLKSASLFMHPRFYETATLDLGQLERAAQILYEAQQQKRRILIYGDYDVDGITSVSLLYLFLKESQENIHYYIPNRFTEGYGVSTRIIDYVQANSVDLIITVDCGISNFKEIELLKSQTTAQVIVMDHHAIPDVLPSADAIINPKFLDATHPFYYLCACGIVYKFLEFYCSYHKISYHLEQYLDLVALATIADVVPLVAENRTLARIGLTVLSQKKRLGLRCLLDVIQLNQGAITARDVGFLIAPYLNAAGRLESATLAVQLLISTNHEEAMQMARRLKQINETRQQLGALILQEAEQQIAASSEDHPILLLFGNQWHPGVIGITASQLVRKWSKPVVIVSCSQETYRGSARTFAKINIYELLKQCHHFFTEFGGHREAAGFSIHYEQAPAFKDFLIQVSKTHIQKEHLESILDIDYHLQPHDMTLDLAKKLQALAPFGNHNPIPTFYTNALRPVEFKTVGGTGKHLKVTFSDESGRIVLDAIGFDLAHKLELLYKDQVELAFQLELNDWRGVTMPQLKLVDLK